MLLPASCNPWMVEMFGSLLWRLGNVMEVASKAENLMPLLEARYLVAGERLHW